MKQTQTFQSFWKRFGKTCAREIVDEIAQLLEEKEVPNPEAARIEDVEITEPTDPQKDSQLRDTI